ncbi:MAG: TraR/DksA C4-type zinc finger protein [Verrucomicrobia bacterium]|nr:TraR/DksA C4-type zinc finger protein [Verrucomicrobiota bacterium]
MKKAKKKASPPRRVPSKVRAATTAELLGLVTKEAANVSVNNVKRRWQRHHRNLMSLRDHLLNQMDERAKDANEAVPAYSMHMADSGTDNFDRDFALSLLSSSQESLYEIEEAIKRIERGTYGRCELTGKPIPEVRLQAIPWTRFTAAAQKQLEREGSSGRARFGALRSVQEAATLETEDADEKEEEEAEEKS